MKWVLEKKLIKGVEHDIATAHYRGAIYQLELSRENPMLQEIRSSKLEYWNGKPELVYFNKRRVTGYGSYLIDEALNALAEERLSLEKMAQELYDKDLERTKRTKENGDGTERSSKN